MLTRLLGAISVTFLCFPCADPCSAQSASPEALATDFTNAWNSHDPKAYDRLFSENAVWVPMAEFRVIGRDEVVKGFAEIHSSWAKDTTASLSDIHVESVTSDVSIVLFHSTVDSPDAQGKSQPGPDRAVILVGVRSADGWRISAGQITKPTE